MSMSKYKRFRITKVINGYLVDDSLAEGGSGDSFVFESLETLIAWLYEWDKSE